MAGSGVAERTDEDALVWAFSDDTPAGTVRVDDPATLRVLGHPLRSAIVRELGRPRSVKEVADRLREPVARLYHHVRLLEQHGLIRVASERKAGSNTERLYQVAGRRIHIGAALRDLVEASASRDVQALVDAATGRFMTAIGDLLASGQEDPAAVHPLVLEGVGPLTHAQARRLQERVRAAIESVMGPDVKTDPDDPRPRYGVTLLMTPFPDHSPDRWVEMRAQEVEVPVKKKKSP